MILTKYIVTISSVALMMSCAEFPNKFENVIEGEKIRPFTIALEPAEAAPGDTVHVKLYYYDGGRSDLNISWQVALNYTMDKYGSAGIETEIRDLDSMALPGGDSTDFFFVVPSGKDNPLLLSTMIPDNFEGIGSKAQILQELDADPAAELPKEFAPYADVFLAIIVLRVKIVSDIELDVTKRLTVRYANRLINSGMMTNVNDNPHIDSIGVIIVGAKGVSNPDSIGFFETDTQFFHSDPFYVDTIAVDKEHSYFLFADTAEAAQVYRSPPEPGAPIGLKHTEELFFNWYYTNHEATNAEWEDLIEIGAGGSLKSRHVVELNIPKDTNMHNFTIRMVCRDYRPEWGRLCSDGTSYSEAKGYFRFQ